MKSIVPNKKQKLSLAKKYRQYLRGMSEPSAKLHNKYNIFDDLNTIDKAMMQEARLFIYRSSGAGKSRNKFEMIFKEKTMPKDRGRRSIKKPKQVKT